MIKKKVEPVYPDVIADIVQKLAEETTVSYQVADQLEIDWCPCCGINVRMRDQAGILFAKFIATPEIARKSGCQLVTIASRATEIASRPEIHQQAVSDMLSACQRPEGQ
jgi:hypothetical protein